MREGNAAKFIFLGLAILSLFTACMLTGAVSLNIADIIELFGNSTNEINRTILLEARLPLAVTAALCGMSLSVAGLLLQTTFRNPLAGPSLLGVSSGASLGVALLIMGSGMGISYSFFGEKILILLGALIGAGVVIMILLAVSRIIKNNVMLLIVGILISYLVSALISWLNFFAQASQVKDFNTWSMGSFMGVTLGDLPLFAALSISGCLITLLLIKPMNIMLLGDRYAQSSGYRPQRVRSLLLLVSGLLTAIATAWCGPVSFIGLIVPHIARFIFRTSNHSVLLPATILTGAFTGLLCAWICVLPSSLGVLPLAAVTPIIGVPIIIYVILSRNKHHALN